MTQEEALKIRAILVNTSVVMQDAIDIILRKAEEIGLDNGIKLQFEFKKAHNDIQRHLSNARNSCEKLNEINQNVLSMQNYDCLRTESNELCRLILFYADRTCDEMKYKHNMIEEFVRNMPSNGKLSDKFIINNFTLR